MAGNDTKTSKSKDNGMKICGFVFLIAGILLIVIGLLMFAFGNLVSADKSAVFKPFFFLAVGVFFSIGIGGSCLLLWAIGKSNSRKKPSEANLAENKETADDPGEGTDGNTGEETDDNPGEEEQPFNVYRDYVFDSRFADFAKHETQIIDKNGKSHGYKMTPDKSVEQLIIEKAVLGKKLAKGGILILPWIPANIIPYLVNRYIYPNGVPEILRILFALVLLFCAVIGIIGACKLVAALHNPIRVGDILNYSDAIDKKMQKKGGEGDLERWRERLKKLREAQEAL